MHRRSHTRFSSSQIPFECFFSAISSPPKNSSVELENVDLQNNHENRNNNYNNIDNNNTNNNINIIVIMVIITPLNIICILYIYFISVFLKLIKFKKCTPKEDTTE